MSAPQLDTDTPRPARRTLSALEHALLGEVRHLRREQREDFRALRQAVERSTRWHYWLVGALLVMQLFLTALLAQARGVDPQGAADAVRTLAPLSPTDALHDFEPREGS